MLGVYLSLETNMLEYLLCFCPEPWRTLGLWCRIELPVLVSAVADPKPYSAHARIEARRLAKIQFWFSARRVGVHATVNTV